MTVPDQVMFRAITPVVLFILAMAARWPNGRFLTVDEAYHWISLSRRFATAVATGNFADTFYFGNPAVTTLWLGALGHTIYDALTVSEILQEHPATFYAIMRLPPAALTALVLALAYPLMERLVGRTIALLAALLWIGEPFLVAHSQLFHMDATLTSLMTLSLLLMLVTLQSGTRSFVRSPWWIASGLVAGLGMLTKSPALLLAPLAGLIVVISRGLPAPLTFRSAYMTVLGYIPPLAIWWSMAALVWIALWPAMWVQPLATIWGVTNEIMFNGGAPHSWGNFFLGRAVDDPGPLFYPVAIPFRLAPWTLIGVLLWAGFSVLDGKEAWKGTNRSLLLPAVFVVLFVAAITVMAKKFDRYALPVFPALTILAAAGFYRGYHCLRDRIAAPTGLLRYFGTSPRWQAAGYVLVVAVLVANLIWYYPYYLAYYNPLLGGGEVAQRVLPVGWGEGLELAAAFIAAQPDGRDRPIAVFYQPVMKPFAPAGVAPLQAAQQPQQVDYAVTYVEQIQRETKPELHAPFRSMKPLHVVRIHGIDYAWVYQVLPPVSVTTDADFGDMVRLHGYNLDTSTVRASGALTVTLVWEALAPSDRDNWIFIHVMNNAGERVAQVDVRLETEHWNPRVWQPGRHISMAQQVPLPPDLPAGTYRLAIGVYDPQTFTRLPLQTDGERAKDAGQDALLLARVTLP
ncbi:MAG: glycosyltransferase family 39 protein [Roseiflexus sp.]